MNEKIVVPALGESVTEATIAKWLKSVGDTVEVDEPIVELETDKVNLEVPSPVSGTIGDIKHKDGEVVEVGAVLGSIQANGNETVQEIKKIEPDVKIEQVKDLPEKKVEKIVEEVKPLELEEEVEDETSLEEETLVLTEEIPTNGSRKNNLSNTLSPSVRKIVAENKIDLKSIQGSGKDGQILKGDLINLMSKSPKPSERKIKFGQEERIKMSRLRQTIAKRLKQAQENAALLTTFNEVDMSNVIKMRKDYQDDFLKKYGVKLGFMSFFVKASIEALKLFPAVNAEIDGEEIVYKNYYNISFAVATDKGLVVPVLKCRRNVFCSN